jgi:hypothetical protein
MEPVVRVFRSHQQADEADREFYASLTPEQRVDIVLQLQNMLRDPNDPASERLAPVYRIVPLERS